MAIKRVVDVSHHQGAVKWAAAKARGIDGVVVRLAYGTTQDTRVADYVPGVRAAGLELLGGYGYATWHYKSKCKGAVDTARSLMEAQVARWIAIARAVGLNGGYMAIDQECESGQSMGLGKANNTTLLAEACQRIRAAGYTPMIYASISWIGSYMDTSRLDADWWVAYYYYQGKDYAAAGDGALPAGARYKAAMDALGDRVVLWQWGSEGLGVAYGMSSSGIDRNWMYDREGESMNQDTPAAAQPTVRRGSRGTAARLAQQRLNANGYCLAEDGIFGARSEQAAQWFQRLHGLSADGVIGGKTWPVLLEHTQVTHVATSWARTGRAAMPWEIVSGGVYYPVWHQDKQSGARQELLDRQGCSICAAASAARKAGIADTPEELLDRALELSRPGSGQIETITVYGVCLLLRAMGVSATWCGIADSDESRAAAEQVITAALLDGRPVAITVKAGADRLFTTSTVHTVLLVGIGLTGQCVVANSNGGRVQETTVAQAVAHAIYGSTDPAEQERWFGKKRTSCGFCVVG